MHISPIKHPDRIVDRDPKVLVGWVHRDMGQVIELQLQGVASQFALLEERLEDQAVLMTHSQAALLGRYLLELSGQDIPRPRKRGLLGLLKR